MKKEEIMVSICCTTYNQEKYIKEALDSFISQKTNFKFEIVVHDDASTDNTPNIIKEYQKTYPDLIKPILQTENQYSKNPPSVFDITLKHAKGKYIAICEGDDYWIDNNKIQMQFDYMEQHPKCTLLGANYQFLENGELTNIIQVFDECDVDIPMFLKRRASVQTGTLFFRKNDLLPFPDYYYKAHVGDLPIELHLIAKGYLHYMPRLVSVYRYQAIGSFSLKNKNNLELKKKNHQKTKEIYESFNKDNNYQYDSEIKEYLLLFDFDFYLSIDDLKELKKKKYHLFFKKLPMKRKLKLYLKNNKFVYWIYSITKKRR